MQLCWQNEISGHIFRENKTFLAMFPEHSTQVHFSAACSEDCRGLSVWLNDPVSPVSCNCVSAPLLRPA